MFYQQFRVLSELLPIIPISRLIGDIDLVLKILGDFRETARFPLADRFYKRTIAVRNVGDSGLAAMVRGKGVFSIKDRAGVGGRLGTVWVIKHRLANN